MYGALYHAFSLNAKGNAHVVRDVWMCSGCRDENVPIMTSGDHPLLRKMLNRLMMK